MIGFSITGSFCTHAASLEVLERLSENYEITPFMSETAYATDTRFGLAADMVKAVEKLCGRRVVHRIVDAEPFGPRVPLELMLILPCTGNTVSKIANGVTDTAVTMAAKAHLRCSRPLLIALSSNDALGANLCNVGALINRKNVYFLPMIQDDPEKKPFSLTADLSYTEKAIDAALRREQLRPVFLTK